MHHLFNSGERDVNETSCIPGYVCYGSDWDISSSISTPNNRSVVRCRNDEKTFCVRPANEDICSDLTVTFTPGECRGSSFNFTKSISVGTYERVHVCSEIQTFTPHLIMFVFIHFFHRFLKSQ